MSWIETASGIALPTPALESGKVKVKCSYSYTADSTNVLTGNPEKKQKSDSKIYEITIK